jgi:shikimate kinase
VRLLALKSGDVIATGGGLYCRDGRPEALRAIGTVVWLTGSFDVLYERARRMGERPMLAGRTRDEVADIYHAREAYYRQADLTVDTTGRNTDQVVTQVLLALRPHLSRAEGSR